LFAAARIAPTNEMTLRQGVSRLIGVYLRLSAAEFCREA
jgi:hypothetical protein